MKKIALILLADSLMTARANSSATEKPEATFLESLEINRPAQTQKKSVTDYFALKEAFVKSHAKVAATAAAQLSKLFTAENIVKELVKTADAIAASVDIEAQRKRFKTITDKLIEYVKANGAGQTVYAQYCPMAFGHMGANWLSGSVKEEIKNRK